MNLKGRYWLISIIISVLSIAGVIYQNFSLAEKYLASSGKTRGMFGLIEIGQLNQKVWLGILIFIGFCVGIISSRQKEKRLFWIIAIIISLLSFCLLFSPIWVSMINITEDGIISL